MAVVTAAGPVTAAADECCLRSLAPYRLREGAAVPNGTLREGVVPTSWHRSECVLGVRTGCGRCGRHERGCARLPPSQVNSAASRPAPASDTIGIVRCSASRLPPLKVATLCHSAVSLVGHGSTAHSSLLLAGFAVQPLAPRLCHHSMCPLSGLFVSRSKSRRLSCQRLRSWWSPPQNHDRQVGATGA